MTLASQRFGLRRHRYPSPIEHPLAQVSKGAGAKRAKRLGAHKTRRPANRSKNRWHGLDGL